MAIGRMHKDVKRNYCKVLFAASILNFTHTNSSVLRLRIYKSITWNMRGISDDICTGGMPLVRNMNAVPAM